MLDLSKFEDKELITTLINSKKDGDKAFAEIYDRYSKNIFAYIIKIVNNKEQAEDLFQETFIKFYQNVKFNYRGGTLIGFLITIARNLCLNYKRDKKTAIPLEESEFVRPISDTDENSEYKELVIAALELLDTDLKEVLILRIYDGMRYEDIAEITGTTVGNARLKVFRAKDKLRGILSPYLKEFIS